MERTKIIIILLLVFCLAGISAVSAQEAERQILDGSMLAAGQSFRFSVTADSDENLSFLGALPEVTAVLCPAGAAESACMTMIMEPERQDGTSVSRPKRSGNMPAGQGQRHLSTPERL